METLPSFALELEQSDYLISFDIKSGYRHFYLHPSMRDYFLFHYCGRYYRCVALPFGWGRSPLWFTKLTRPLVQYMREKCGYRVLPYIDDFLVAGSPPGRPATEQDCRRARERLTKLFASLGITRHPTKGCWKGGRQIDHLGMHVDTETMRVYVSDSKVKKVQSLASKIILRAQRNRRLVPAELLRHFCGVCVSLTLAVPLARFYTRNLYFDITGAEREFARDLAANKEPSEWGGIQAATSHRGYCGRVRLSRQSLRDLRFWRGLTRGEGRNLHPVAPDLTMHSDAANVGYGGALGSNTLAGSQGSWVAQGFWTARDRAESINLRELRAVRLLLQKSFANYASQPQVRQRLVHEDNQAVVHILNAMVSSSPAMMSELRKLQKLLRVLGVQVESRWLPSAVNKYADSLSRTWDPGDTQASEQLVKDICRQYHFDRPAFLMRPLNEPRPARVKQVCEQLQTFWGDGRSRLWNPPFDFLPVVVRKIEVEEASGVLIAPHWPAQPWYARLQRVATRLRLLEGAAHATLTGSNINPAWRLCVAEVGYKNFGPRESERPCLDVPGLRQRPEEPKKPRGCSRP